MGAITERGWQVIPSQHEMILHAPIISFSLYINSVEQATIYSDKGSIATSRYKQEQLIHLLFLI